ncbi:unnamed protein product [Brachionus calyciflorus]|uniref:Serpin domain-containing protein n=1 Tax=Brachionus calyciflorus TaxID=104777 RepID=A0A813XS35_9BILA|nr:unnamed protein product [Brachionus calyciflorus]
MSLCLIGSDGTTFTSLQRSLNLSNYTKSQILNLNKQTLKSLNIQNEKNISLSTANRIYISHNFNITKKFSTLAKQYFESDVLNLNTNNPVESSMSINQWVSNKTHHKINNIINPNVISSETSLILLNAIYFKGIWKFKFDKSITKKENFYLSNGKVEKIDMMHLNKKFKFIYMPGGLKADLIELAYSSDKISMVILLPHENNSLENIQKEINLNILNQILKKDKNFEQVNLKIPRFKLEFKRDLENFFKSQTEAKAFSKSEANFSGISTNSKGLFISDVIHQAVVEVNEEGTEAAATTAIIIQKSIAPSQQQVFNFVCNRPFLFYIYDKMTNTILFSGKYSKP